MKTFTIPCAALLAATMAAPLQAETPDAGVAPKPLFKRVAAPGATAGKRITIQIAPEDDWYRREPSPDPGVRSDEDVIAVPVPSAYAAFWGAISPRMSANGPATLDAALAALRQVPQINGPRLDDMRRITEVYGRDILRMTVGTRVSPALVAAVISVESAGRAQAVSSAGAQGVMQLMPATAERFGVTDWTLPEENIRGGVAYLDWLSGHFDNDPLMILAGYNAGEGAVRKHQGVPPFAETRAYVPKVLAAWKVAAGLCRTPPELLSDGCVFLTGG